MSTPTTHCKGMEGLIAEGKEIVQMPGDSVAKDAAIIAAAQRVEHYEIAGYGTARTLAGELDQSDARDLLDQTLDEESDADKLLTKIATGGMLKTGINEKAGGATDRSERQGRLRLLDTNAKVFADIVPRVVAASPTLASWLPQGAGVRHRTRVVPAHRRTRSSFTSSWRTSRRSYGGGFSFRPTSSWRRCTECSRSPWDGRTATSTGSTSPARRMECQTTNGPRPTSPTIAA